MKTELNPGRIRILHELLRRAGPLGKSVFLFTLIFVLNINLIGYAGVACGLV